MAEHFFIVGAQRSGTTHLYRLLDEHPQIEMAKPKKPEPKFFLLDDLYSRGLTYYEREYFSRAGNARMRGEKSTSYMESETAALRIAEAYPRAKIIFLLREPLARAISNYRFSVANGFETLPLEEAFNREAQRREDFDPARVSASPYAYLHRGRYIDFIERYERLFPSDALHVTLHEDLIEDAGVLRGLYAFLGVEADFEPPSWGERVNQGEGPAIELQPEEAAKLRERFAEPNARLAERFGLDLSRWTRAAPLR